MTYYLWELLRDTYQEIGQLSVSKATGGTTTTLVDSKLTGQKDDDYKGGAVIILEDAGGAGAAPEGEFARVSSYTDVTGTLTIETLTAAPASGDLYGLVSEYYPLYQMIELANLGLRGLGEIPLTDTTTLDTADNKTEYAAAVTWKRRPPFRVDIQTNTGDSDDNRWEQINWWEYVPANPGETGLIIFSEQLASGRDLRVWYMDRHPRINAYNDVIYEGIASTLAVMAAVEKAINWQLGRLDGENAFLVQRFNDAKTELDRAKDKYPMWMPPKRSRSRMAGK